MIIEVFICTSKVGSECYDEIELHDDATDEEIEEAAREVAFNMIDWSYKKNEHTNK